METIISPAGHGRGGAPKWPGGRPPGTAPHLVPIFSTGIGNFPSRTCHTSRWPGHSARRSAPRQGVFRPRAPPPPFRGPEGGEVW